ncbi:CBS domain-containing protein [Spirochaeta thermophila]|uniref:Transcriptional regulatory protein n=1 Tax=Winmispira thermophila (strain ATCC 49972 / DSM 6192 / RI 19.B1) TaxID=665571 RepID=E0RUA0_WINT6|nr:CBS domain-containing protein [Spirochaeta thermophila]ADN02321.1 transcriptional regulatory protein [Spirochaeta thermophila DSM 6192]
MDQTPLSDIPSPRLLELIYTLKVRDVMTRDLITATPDEPLRSIQHKMKANRITGVPVIQKHRLVGIVSLDDIITALDKGYIDEPAGRHMTRNVVVLEEDMPLRFAISYLDKYHYGRFPVLDKKGSLVGIVTSRDIITSLLLQANRALEQMEATLYRRSYEGHPPEAGSYTREFYIRQYDFEHAGTASTQIKRILTERGLPPKVVRRASIAAYELEMNIVVHSVGGVLRLVLTPRRVEITAEDSGPGIEDIALALQEGYSTAADWIRSLGFGAGMGLPNTKRVADEFSIHSTPGKGTIVKVAISLQGGEDAHDKADTPSG